MTSTLDPSSSTGPDRSTRSLAPWWVAAGLVAAAGLIVGTVWAVMNMLALVHRPAGFPHTPVPGSVLIELAEGEKAVVYIEASTTGAARAAEVTVRTSDGDAVATHRYSGLVQYDVDGEPGRLGIAVRSFDAPVAGRYTVTAPAVDGPRGSVLAVGEDLSEGLVAALLPPVLLALGMFVLAGVLAVTPIRHSRPPSSDHEPPQNKKPVRGKPRPSGSRRDSS